MDWPEEAENGQDDSGIFEDEQIKGKLCPKIIF